MHLILAAHGKLAQEVVHSANMVFGHLDDLDVVTFLPGENAETLKEKYQEILGKCSEEEQILFLVDLFGGSPYNAAFETMMGQDRMDVITGLSLPMLIDVAGIRMMNEEIRAAEVYDELGADTYIRSCRKMLNDTKTEADEEDDEL